MNIVIIGGVAGINCYGTLNQKGVQVTLVDKKNYYNFFRRLFIKLLLPF
jgi:NADH dehydrogenase FAD-containing subunit